MSYEKVVTIVTARLASHGLLGKILLPLGPASVLEHVVERAQLMQRADGLLVATTRESADDRIEALCLERGWACRRGADADLLERCWRAASSVQADHIVLLGGDQPFFSWQEADVLIDHHLRQHADVTHNLPTRDSGMPEGTGCAVVRAQALETAFREAGEQLREHPLQYLFERPRRFRIVTRRAPPELARPNYRLGLESASDLERLRRIQCALGDARCIDLAHAVALLDNDAAARSVAM